MFDTPPDVTAALALCDRVDDCFLSGFSRLGSAQTDALASLVASFSGSPLEARLNDAVAAIGRNELTGDTFLTLAIARASLLGAAHDALLLQAATALGRTLPDDVAGPAVLPWSGAPANLAQAVRHWLVELAIAGFARVEASALLPFTATIERLCDDPALIRLSALLVGYHAELVASCPVPDAAAVPRRRWADLWTRAMLLSVGAVHAEPTAVEGALVPMGIEVRQHGHVASLVGHGWIGDTPVRVGMQAFKVAVVRGPELFDLFKPQLTDVLAGFAGPAELTVSGVLGVAGELQVKAAKVGKPIDTGALADRLAKGGAAVVARIPAADRHPVLLSLPVGGRGSPEALGVPVRGWYDRSSTLTDELGEVDHWVGLLRWDDGFFVQPLGAAVKAGKKLEWRSNAAYAKDKPKSRAKPALDVLRAKASKLLRQKA
ncbi:MAG: hypothetical protein ABMA64_25795 [Myxococcota bacterium]